MRSQIFPTNPNEYGGQPFVRPLTFIFLLIVVVRSGIHLFAPDGGAESIAGIDTSVSGGENIIAIFHQWGAIQLLLSIVLLVLFFRYKGLTPLIVLILSLDAPLRALAGQMGEIQSTRTPPGEALNWPVFIVLAILFATSLVSRNR